MLTEKHPEHMQQLGEGTFTSINWRGMTKDNCKAI